MGTLLELLRSLLSLLFPLRDNAALVEETSFENFSRLISPRQLTGSTVGLLPYRHRVIRSIILEAKFNRNKKAISLLSGVLKDYIEGISEDSAVLGNTTYVLVPVPLGADRQKKRGYNQVEEVCRATGLPVNAGLLERTRETLPQTELKRGARLENVRGAFAVAGTIDPSVTYVVVDDVTTTGATMQEVMETLTAAGSKSVKGVAFAY